MPTYNYRVKQPDGMIMEGSLDATTSTVAAAMLEDRGFSVLSIDAQGGAWKMGFSLHRVHTKDLVIWSRQLSVLISAKVPVVQALRDTITQTANPALQKIVSVIADEVSAGERLSVSLGKYPRVFNDFFANLVRSGETSGRLDEVLNYIAEQLEKDYELNSKIKGALIYPGFIISVMAILGVVMMIFVVPQLTEMLIQTGAALPLSTRILISISNLFINWWWLMLAGIVGLVTAVVYWVRTPSGKSFRDSLLLKLPVFGKLLTYIYIVRFSRGLETLMRGGVDLVDSLEIVSKVPGNEVYRVMILETKAVVSDGQSISTVFNRSKKIPPMVGQMLATGEQSGQIVNMLQTIGGFYSREVTNIVNNLVALLEPAIMVLLGVGVGIMVAAIILPMYQVSANL